MPKRGILPQVKKIVKTLVFIALCAFHASGLHFYPRFSDRFNSIYEDRATAHILYTFVVHRFNCWRGGSDPKAACRFRHWRSRMQFGTDNALQPRTHSIIPKDMNWNDGTSLPWNIWGLR